MKHTGYDLVQLQSLPLEAKVVLSKQRIKQWYDYFDGQVYISFSGGKDSTVLKHLVETTTGVYDVPSVYDNTGLEYPEIRRFAMEQPNVTMIYPKLAFNQVIEKYGYPIISKEQALYIYEARNSKSEKLRCKRLYGDDKGRFKISDKWQFVVNAPFRVSDMCCDVMKKRPFEKYEKETGRAPIVGTMASESILRKNRWLKSGCNAFDNKRPVSQPLSFWTEQDVLKYIVKNDLEYADVYGEIVKDDNGTYITTGVDRTGCIFCGFGCHLEPPPNRFQRLKETHPRQYEYCIGGGEYVDGLWLPNKEGLGLARVLDFIGVDYK